MSTGPRQGVGGRIRSIFGYRSGCSDLGGRHIIGKPAPPILALADLAGARECDFAKEIKPW